VCGGWRCESSIACSDNSQCQNGSESIAGILSLIHGRYAETSTTRLVAHIGGPAANSRLKQRKPTICVQATVRQLTEDPTFCDENDCLNGGTNKPSEETCDCPAGLAGELCETLETTNAFLPDTQTTSGSPNFCENPCLNFRCCVPGQNKGLFLRGFFGWAL